MPYVFMEELGEGMDAADVYSADDYNAIVTERDGLVAERDALIGERDSLTNDLNDAKTKFANAFLSSPQQAKQSNAEDMRREDTVLSFDELFTGRSGNAN